MDFTNKKYLSSALLDLENHILPKSIIQYIQPIEKILFTSDYDKSSYLRSERTQKLVGLGSQKLSQRKEGILSTG